jgi:tetratricopeptide (TPR) repeat protein
MELRTPVVLIIFKRPEATTRVFEVIRQVQPSKLLVIADGPRLDCPEELEKCVAARKIVEQVDWNCEVLTNYSDINLGCKTRVASGLNWVFEQVEEAIILEDDCIPDPTFFYFCEELLERYRNDERVMQITGENTHGYQSTHSSYYFSQYSFYWGWATWRRAWRLFDKQMEAWQKTRKSQWLENLLGNQERAKYWTEIFDLTYNGFNSWGWAWTFTCFMNQGFCIVPNQNLISNVGFGKDAAHTTWEVDEIADLLTQSMVFPLKHPHEVQVNIRAEEVIDKMRFTGRKYLKGMRQQALSLFDKGEYQTALQIWDYCIQFRPELTDLYYEKARCLQQLGNDAQAIECLQQLLKLHPEHKQAGLLLNDIYQKKNGYLLNIGCKNHQKIKIENTTNRLLVYTMGKVASTSVANSLRKYIENATVYDIHFLNKNFINKNLDRGHCRDSLFVLNHWMNQPLKIISLVRNPIEVNISSFFQNIERHYPELSQTQINAINIHEMIDKFKSLDPTYPLTWFEKEFRDQLGFDIYSVPFSALGWKTYIHNKYHILVMQVELPDAEKENVIKSFSSSHTLKLGNKNLSSEKWYHHKYLEFRTKLVLSREYIENCLFSTYTQYFYTNEQINSFYQKY